MTAKRTTDTVKALQEANKRLKKELADRKAIEAVLRDNEAKYRRIFEHAVEGIFQMTAEGKLLGVNPALARMLGFDSAHEVEPYFKDHGMESFIAVEDKTRIGRILRDQGSIEGYELQVRRRDGSTIWVSLSGRLVWEEEGAAGFVEGIAEDITKRKLAEIALQESETRYRSLVETSLVAFFIMQDGFFQFVNAHFCEISGYSPGEIPGKLTPFNLAHESEWPRLREMIDRLRYHGPQEHEFKGVKKDGTIITVRMTTSVCALNGKPAVVGTAVDATREAMLESQLLQAQKMEAIGTLAGGIAHDFNNILMALMGYGNLLQVRMGADNPVRTYADQIIACTERAANLTQSLLAFSRKQRMEIRSCDVNAIVANAEKLLRRLLREDIELVFMPGRDLMVMADMHQMEQVVMNLATNARDAMPDGGRLLIETAEARIDDKFIKSRGYGERGVYGVISVTDTGTGMDERTQKKIFEPFFTTKEVGKGTGLGLSTIYGIVKQHKGYIDVVSTPGKGSVFRIYLPAGSTIEVIPEVPRPAKGGTETLLFVEDNTDNRKVTTDILRMKGYTVIEAADGEDAVKKFIEYCEDVDLVIADIVMPKMSGKEAYQRIREIKPDTKVLFMSGYTRDVILEKGIYDYLSKPVPPETLLRKVREVIDKPRSETAEHIPAR